MGFLDELRKPSMSSIYNSNPINNDDEDSRMLSIDAEMRRRNNNDMMKQQSFMSDLSNRQPRIQNVFGQAQEKPMDVIFKDNAITPFQRESLNLKKDDINVDRSKLDLSAKLGTEKLGLAKDKHELEVEKNKNIYETKQADMQRKADEAARKAEIAEKTLANKQGDAAATLEFHKAQLEATNARHALEMHQRENALTEAQRLHDAQIEDMKGKREDNKNIEKTTELSDDEKKKTETTTKGAKQRIKVMGPNGQAGTIEVGDKLPKGWQTVQ